MSRVAPAEVAQLLIDIALCLDLRGENRFKISAHHKAARALEKFEGDLVVLAAEGQLTSIAGVGKGLADKIAEALETGDIAERLELRKKLPTGLFDLLKIQGIGPKKVKILYKKLGVTSLGELEYACNENRLITLDGFGQKSQEKILSGIETLHRYQNKVLLPEGVELAARLLGFLREDATVIKASTVGDLRRRMEVIASIDLLVATNAPALVIERFCTAPGLAEIQTDGATTVSCSLPSGLRANLTVTPESAYVSKLFELTGSDTFITVIKSMDAWRPLSSGDGPPENEAAIFERLGLDYLPPETREWEHRPPTGHEKPLLEESDITGLFHCHTTYSDGRNTLREMADACRALGHSYLGLSDHSRSAHYAGGLSIEELQAQGEEIDALNAGYNDFHIFKGVESDILTDGSLDYPHDILAALDFVIISVHSGFTQDREEMTARIIRAIEHPATTMLGHMTGRLLLARDGYPLDITKIINACATNNVIIELNANPQRLDIDWRSIGAALNAGVKLSINPDAHRIPGLKHLSWGVTAARKGGATKADVFNTLPVEAVATTLAARK